MDLPDDAIDWLDTRARLRKTSRAALVREAVDNFRSQAGISGIDAAFGIWKDRDDIGDGVEFQRAIRAEWDREWDPVIDDE